MIVQLFCVCVCAVYCTVYVYGTVICIVEIQNPTHS
jgi:predicted DNA repair protein MutK